MNARTSTRSRRARGMATVGVLLIAWVVAVPPLSTAKSSRQSAAARAWERSVRSRGVDPATIANPLAVTDEMRKVAREAAGPGSDMQKLRRLHRFLLDEDAFPFDYSSSGTYPAAEVFRSRRGNCVSFTILFLALARAAGLPVRAALPKVAPTIEKAGDLIVVSNHIVAIHERPGGADVFDFYLSRAGPLAGLRPIDDLWVTAIYLNNLGADDLLDERLQSAAEHLERAIALAPEFTPAYGNLGLVRRQLGDIDGAFDVYRRSLAIDPKFPTVLNNLASLYMSLGRVPEARAAIAAADRGRSTPYMLLIRGDFEMQDGKFRRALRLYRQAVRLGGDLADTHLAVGRAQMARGRTEAARKAFARVLELEPDSADARRALETLGQVD